MSRESPTRKKRIQAPEATRLLLRQEIPTMPRGAKMSTPRCAPETARPRPLAGFVHRVAERRSRRLRSFLKVRASAHRVHATVSPRYYGALPAPFFPLASRQTITPRVSSMRAILAKDPPLAFPLPSPRRSLSVTRKIAARVSFRAECCGGLALPQTNLLAHPEQKQTARIVPGDAAARPVENPNPQAALPFRETRGVPAVKPFLRLVVLDDRRKTHPAHHRANHAHRPSAPEE